MPASRTSFASRADFMRRVAAAYRSAGAPAIAVPLLVAHSALATGAGRNVWNFNIGVLRAGASGGPVAELRTREWTGTAYRQELAQWRAYGSLEESARDLLRLLGASRYAGARALLELGREAWFQALGVAGFYTEPTSRHVPRYRRVLAEVRRARV